MSAAEITRRGFVAGAAGLGGIAVLVPDSLAFQLQGRLSPTFSGGTFPDGVASGDPTPTGITLWSRVAGVTGTGSVLLEVATDKSFKKVVKSSLVPADPTRQWIVKARVTGLKPYTQYYYRFATKTKNGPVGRFRTALPADSTQTVKFAYFSCQMFEYGFFNAHKLMASDDIDFVLNLGDFIYETAFDMANPVGSDPGKPAVRKHGFKGSTVFSGPVSYADYCQRYQAYRADTDLKANLAAHAMISTWDDHEVMNNYAGAAADGGDASKTVPNANPAYSFIGYSNDRRINAYKAWFDNMPTFPRNSGGYQLYQKASYGKNLDLWVLDQRQYRDAQACGFRASNVDPATCSELGNPRSYLGATQMNWLQGGIASSTAKWKVIGNEVVIMTNREPNGNLASTDGWAGYPVERESLLSAIRTGAVKNVVFATGDYHTFMAGEVRDAANRTVATEFATGSITAPSDAEIASILKTPGFGTPDNPTVPSGYTEAKYLAANPYMKEFDQLKHGYVLASASATQFSATFKKLSTIRSQSTALAAQKTYRVAANSTTIV